MGGYTYLQLLLQLRWRLLFGLAGPRSFHAGLGRRFCQRQKAKSDSPDLALADAGRGGGHRSRPRTPPRSPRLVPPPLASSLLISLASPAIAPQSGAARGIRVGGSGGRERGGARTCSSCFSSSGVFCLDSLSHGAFIAGCASARDKRRRQIPRLAPTSSWQKPRELWEENSPQRNLPLQRWAPAQDSCQHSTCDRVGHGCAQERLGDAGREGRQGRRSPCSSPTTIGNGSAGEGVRGELRPPARATCLFAEGLRSPFFSSRARHFTHLGHF